MFANFQLYSVGWVSSDHKPTHRRSRGGCVPCRHRRKKCDEVRPVCSSCFSRQVDCRWRKDSTLGHSEDTDTSSHISASPSYTHSPKSESDAQSPSPSLCRDVHSLQLHRFSPSTVLMDCAKSLPSCSLIGLLHVFDQATSGHDFGHKYSLLTQGFSSMAQSRSTLHAWLACSAMLVAQLQPRWRAHALMQYTEAIRELRTNILSGADDESNFVTVLILNVFSRFGDFGNSSSMMHLKAAVKIHAAIARPPSNVFQALVLEAFIYQIAINSTFRPSYLSDYQDLSRIIRLLSRSSVLKPNCGGSHFLKAGLSVWLPTWCLDIIFKASHLLHHRNDMSSDDLQTKVQQLQMQVNELQKEVAASTSPSDECGRPCSTKELSIDGTSFHSVDIADEGVHMRELYFLATGLIIAKLACPEFSAHDPSIASIARTALLHLRHIRANLPYLLWAIAVLGTAVTVNEDKSVIVAHLEAMRHFSGERSISSVLRFLSSAWGQEARYISISTTGMELGNGIGNSSVEEFSSERPLGLDVLFDKSLLESVIT